MPNAASGTGRILYYNQSLTEDTEVRLRRFAKFAEDVGPRAPALNSPPGLGLQSWPDEAERSEQR
jgi:hypothetical protein